MALKLKAGHSPNPRLQPLVEGAVKIDGVELEWEFLSPGELFHKQLVENCYDLFEFSIADYFVVATRREWDHLGWIALPVFMSKPLALYYRFYAHKAAGVRTLADFRGKRFGLPDYGMTAGVWLRIMLRTLHGINAQDLVWYNGRPASERHGRILDIDQSPTPGLELINLERKGELDELLQRGEVQIVMADEISTPAHASDTVELLSTPEFVQGLVQDLYHARGVTPVNHTLAIKRKYLDDDPGLALRVYQACEASKQEAYRRARQAAGGYLLFADVAFADQAKVLGDDPFPFGTEANRATLEHIAEQLRLDGLIKEEPDLNRLWLQPA